jgi:hypothetical protein
LAIEDLLVGMIAGALGSLVLWLTLGRALMLRYAGESVVRALTDPDERTQAAIKNILTISWNWFVTAEIETGKTLKEVNEEGVERSVKEKVPPYIILARSITTHLKMSIMGKTSAANKQAEELQAAIGADLQDPNNPLGSMMRSALPTALLRAQKTGDYASVAQVVLMPMVQEWLKKRINQPPGTAGTAAPLTGDLRF